MSAAELAGADAPRPADGLLHPVVIGALVLLAVNDQVLKASAPGPLTWILSDVAGLIVAPLALDARAAVAQHRKEPLSRSRSHGPSPSSSRSHEPPLFPVQGRQQRPGPAVSEETSTAFTKKEYVSDTGQSSTSASSRPLRVSLSRVPFPAVR